jgi:hypothetical protein
MQQRTLSGVSFLKCTVERRRKIAVIHHLAGTIEYFDELVAIHADKGIVKASDLMKAGLFLASIIRSPEKRIFIVARRKNDPEIQAAEGVTLERFKV